MNHLSKHWKTYLTTYVAIGAAIAAYDLYQNPANRTVQAAVQDVALWPMAVWGLVAGA